MLRLRYNAVLTQFDFFHNVITQRSENQTGVWLSVLDVASADALQLKHKFFDAPPIICYLDRGAGAAIRRARTRLPGGGSNSRRHHKNPTRADGRKRNCVFGKLYFLCQDNFNDDLSERRTSLSERDNH
jgi:hypothetical protein